MTLMDLPPGWHFSIEDRPSPAARNRLGRELGKHNRPYLRNPKWQWLGVFVREPDRNIAAGLAGSTYGDWLFVHDFWVRAMVFVQVGSQKSGSRAPRQLTDDGNVEIHRARSEGAGRRKTGRPVSIELTLRATPLPGRQRGILAQCRDSAWAVAYEC